MLVSYPALFYYDTEGSEVVPFFITFPDFTNSATQGESISDAIAMASDWLGMNEDLSFKSMVMTDLSSYMDQDQLVKKTLTNVILEEKIK